MTSTKIRIDQVRIESDTWQDLMTGIAEKTCWRCHTEVFVYVESVDACTLELTRFDAVSEPFKPFEGRIFDSEVEARWRPVQGGTWAAWIVREHQSKGEPAHRVVRRYYLRGIRGENDNEFREARYPRTRFVYPVQNTSPHDRAYIEVAEYWHAEPSWDGLDHDGATQELTRPLLFAHRFMAVSAGSDQPRREVERE